MFITRRELWRLALPLYVVFMLNFIGDNLAHWFYEVNKIDTVMHFLGGVAMANAAYIVLTCLQRGGFLQATKPVLAVIMVLAVLGAAVVWELYEYAHDFYYATQMQPSIADTMKDQVTGGAGGIVFAIGYLLLKKEKQ